MLSPGRDRRCCGGLLEKKIPSRKSRGTRRLTSTYARGRGRPGRGPSRPGPPRCQLAEVSSAGRWRCAQQPPRGVVWAVRLCLLLLKIAVYLLSCSTHFIFTLVEVASIHISRSPVWLNVIKSRPRPNLSRQATLTRPPLQFSYKQRPNISQGRRISRPDEATASIITRLHSYGDDTGSGSSGTSRPTGLQNWLIPSHFSL